MHDQELLERYVEAEAAFLRFGDDNNGVDLIGAVAPVEVEYGTLRSRCTLMYQPWRTVLRVSGTDARDFLHRMLTQRLDDLPTGGVRRGFWINRKGRIDADFCVQAYQDAEGGEFFHLDTSMLSVERALETLSNFVIVEDVEIVHRTDLRRFALTGPAGPALLERVGAVALPEDGRCINGTIADVPVFVERHNHLATPTFELAVGDGVGTVFDALCTSPASFATSPDPEDERARPIGWHAFNIARIESGWPMYELDFGPDSLPHETGVLEDRVDFNKGCYPGQEVVARIHSRGNPKQRLVGLRVNPTDDDAPQPVTGGAVFLPDDTSTPIGGVTSSCLSPMLGNQPICFAMVRFKESEPGTSLLVDAEGSLIEATVQPALRFWPTASTPV